MKFKLIIFTFFILLIGCKSTSEAVDDLPKIRKSKLIKLNAAKSFTNSAYNTAKINSKMSYEIGGSSHKLGLKIRIQKGQKIWMSADFFGIPVAKLFVEQDQVRYYNKIDKSYFEGSFDFLKQLSGIEIKYDDFEAILTGDTMVDIDDRIYQLFRGYGFYYFRNVNLSSYERTVEIQPDNYKLKLQSISSDSNHRVFKAIYKKLKDFEGYLFPVDIEIHAKNKDKLSAISMRYTSVKFNEELSFPYEVPRDCTNRVVLKRKKK